MYMPIVFFLVSSISQVFSGNVLVLCPMCSRSHKNVIEATVEGLAKRNHSITIVSSDKTPISSPNIRDIVIMDGFDIFASHNALELRKIGVFRTAIELQSVSKQMVDGCHATYQNPEFLQLMNGAFDLVIIDLFSNHCLHGFANKIKAPVISSSPLPIPPPFAMSIGSYLPPSFVPDVWLPFGQEMSLLERTLNFLLPRILWSFYFSVYGEYEKVYKQYLGEDVPGLAELESDISMVLVNSHFSVNSPRPTLPDIVEIGGVHCRPGRPLPDDLEEFMAGSKDGVIIFSLGSIIHSRDMPEETRKAFLNAFSRLKQRVVWKWDLGDMKDLPPNIMLLKWLPLQDILAHPKTRLFITHGGLLSTQEAIYHGVPMVGVPVWGDQDFNIKRYVEAGIAVFLEILDVQEKHVLGAVEAVLRDPKYQNNINALSTLFRDRPQAAVDTAVFWSEYVMRHKGAPQLRSAARRLNFIQYHSLDVIALIFLVLLLSLFSTYFIVLRLCRKVFGKSTTAINEHQTVKALLSLKKIGEPGHDHRRSSRVLRT